MGLKCCATSLFSARFLVFFEGMCQIICDGSQHQKFAGWPHQWRWPFGGDGRLCVLCEWSQDVLHTFAYYIHICHLRISANLCAMRL